MQKKSAFVDRHCHGIVFCWFGLFVLKLINLIVGTARSKIMLKTDNCWANRRSVDTNGLIIYI